jgi:hypothetical protein
VTTALWLFLAQGALGAFDTLYFHEYVARLPAGSGRTRTELSLHAGRGAIYGLLFLTLPSRDWRGALAFVLASLIAVEIVLTLIDFAIEPAARAPADVRPGERVTHGLMAIIYGAALASMAPDVLAWMRDTTALLPAHRAVPAIVTCLLSVLGAGVLLSAARDAAAAAGITGRRR